MGQQTSMSSGVSCTQLLQTPIPAKKVELKETRSETFSRGCDAWPSGKKKGRARRPSELKITDPRPTVCLGALLAEAW